MQKYKKAFQFSHQLISTLLDVIWMNLFFTGKVIQKK